VTPNFGFREGFARVSDVVRAATSLATALLNGTMSAADFKKLATAVAADASTGKGLLLQSFRTPLIDFLAPGATYNFDMPLVAGKKFYPMVNANWCNILVRDANPTTNLSFQLVQNGTALEVGLNVTAANTNLQPAPERVAAGTLTSQLRDMTTFPLGILITAPFTGGGITVCNGFFELWGTYQ
jgi:hypothetical protein